MEPLIINTILTFKEYLKLLLILRFKSTQIIWDLCWVVSFPYLIYLSYNDFLKNPTEIKNIIVSLSITTFILFIYPIYIYYIYKKSFFSSENIMRENILVEIYDAKIVFKTEFSTNTIETEKINEIKIYDSFVTFDFYQNFIVINRKKLSNTEDKKLIEKINKYTKKIIIKCPKVLRFILYHTLLV